MPALMLLLPSKSCWAPYYSNPIGTLKVGNMVGCRSASWEDQVGEGQGTDLKRPVEGLPNGAASYPKTMLNPR